MGIWPLRQDRSGPGRRRHPRHAEIQPAAAGRELSLLRNWRESAQRPPSGAAFFMAAILPVAKPGAGRLGISLPNRGTDMRYSLIAGTALLMLAACGGGGGPQNIQLSDGGGSSYAPPPPAGPHELSATERTAVQTALAAQVRGASTASTVAVRGDDGVVTVCGTLNTGA